MKGIYLASYKAYHEKYDLVYQDINGKRDLGGCMLSIDLSDYDFILATPPCNFWSRANYRRYTSKYSQATKHLLPDILDKLRKLGKPYIVENVRNEPLFKKYNILDKADYVYYYGRHTYWTNIPFNPYGIKQINDNIKDVSADKRQGGYNVKQVFDYWLDTLLFNSLKDFSTSLTSPPVRKHMSASE